MRYWKTSPQLWHRLKPLAREMRHDPTPAEDRLWQRLRRAQIHGVSFRRQHSIERFIVDFYCAKARLVIELDGPIHQYTVEQDAIRQEFLESKGLQVLRFENMDVFNTLDAVVAVIADAVARRTPPHPSP
jgi:very-short-patch-repair endonuclease